MIFPTIILYNILISELNKSEVVSNVRHFKLLSPHSRFEDFHFSTAYPLISTQFRSCLQNSFWSILKNVISLRKGFSHIKTKMFL